MSAADAAKYDNVLERSKTTSTNGEKTVYEYTKFNHCVQQEGETVDDFITDLYRLVENCKYSTLHACVTSWCEIG